MNRYFSLLGIIFILLSAFLLFVDFNGGRVGALVITDGIPIANFAAFLFGIIFLPVGSGLAFFGFSYRGPVYAAGTTSGASFASSGLAKAILAVAIIAVVVGAVSLAAVVAVDSSISGITSKTAVSTVTVAGPTTTVTTGGIGINTAPTTDFYRIDWCNTDNTGQDRYCPSQIVVDQGDIVVILFEHNDTDAHTFTITATYSFQINATFGMAGETNVNGSGVFYANGMHNFVTNANFTASCVNTSTFSQQSTGVSGSLCVSGSSLLAPLGTVAFVNPTPGLPLNSSAPDGGLVALNDTNSVVFQEPGGNMSIAYAGGACSASACTNPETGLPAGGETYGIAAFQATTAGTYEFFCHYHISNGMFGYITVLPNAYCSSHASSCGISNSTT